KWVGLAALTSSFLMSVTTHLTTDIAPVPLLWVIPLGLYLLSFVVVFSRWPESARRVVGRFTPMLLCFLAVALLTRAGEPMAVIAAVHLAAFFAVALLCHGELAADRPAANQLTTFYLWLSVGGVLGGLFNTFVAPVVFSSLGNVEYPLAIVLAALVRPSPFGWKRSDFAWPLAVAALTAVFVFGVPMVFPKATSDNPADLMLDRVVRGGLSFGVPAAVAFALVWRPVRFALCLAAVMVVGSFAPNPHGRTLETSRNFFGTLRVTRSDDGQFTRIVHGTTLHGQQKAGEGRPVPATYYHPSGPLGQVFAGLPPERRKRVGVVGLGAGAAAAYGNAGETWTFFEIDPGVVRIAQDTRYFTFLSTCPATFDIRLGDARRELQYDRDSPKFDVLVLDAFNSDSVPVHLLTVEAMRLYLSRLSDRGVIALHVSNRYLDLAPLVARVAAAVDPTLVAKWDDDRAVSDAQKAEGKTASTWVLLARRAEDVPTQPNGRLNPRWQALPAGAGPVWRDDFSNLLGVWKRDGDGD
ncbi:MAG TPA: fused MFS/spermidine synthase, partial [Gemmataceae bacterium]|nr:fused MFS/spermidine synthase [Gemmataceae bacterium]